MNTQKDTDFTEKLAKTKLQSRKKVYTDEQIEKMIKLREDGLSYRLISICMLEECKLSISHSTIRNLIKNYEEEKKGKDKILTNVILYIKAYEKDVKILQKKQSSNQISMQEQEELDKLLQKKEEMQAYKVFVNILIGLESVYYGIDRPFPF